MSNYTFSNEDIDLISVLLADWIKSWDDIERLILQLEVKFTNPELINNILNKINGVKRGSSFIGLVLMTKLTNEMESAINKIQLQNLNVNSEFIDILLNCHYTLKKTLLEMNELIKEHHSLPSNSQISITIFNSAIIYEHIYQLNSFIQKSISESRIVEEHTSALLENHETYNNESMQMSHIPLNEPFINPTKEQFFFELYEYLDEMERALAMMDKVENQNDALILLKHALQNLHLSIDTFNLYQIQDNENLFTHIKETSSSFENLLNVIQNRHLDCSKLNLNLSYEIVCYIKEILELIVLEKEQVHFNNELLVKIVNETEKIESTKSEVIALPPTVERSEVNTELTINATSSQSIRVSQDKLEKMMNMISELLITKNAFMHISAKINADYTISELSKEVKQIGSMVNRISDELQNTIMSMRMVEINTLFQKMPRIIRDVAQSTGKKMQLVMKGERTEIDKTIIEQISDPIVHLIRNAADHGIENQDVRLAKGKEETGTIILRAYNKNKHVCIEIEDDGKGIDAQVIKQKAINKGFITDENAERMTHNELLNLIFLPGFSTAEQITELSGRGVGMDVVKSNIEKINGSIAIESEVDKGTKIVIHLPLTLAVSRGLTVKVSSETYIIPIEYVSETVKININDIHEYNGKEFVYLRNEVVGIDWLSSLFLLGERDQSIEEVCTVIISNGHEKFGLVVDKLLNEQEFVIKSLSGHLAAIPGISGSTLLGSGQVVLIINPVDLMHFNNEGTL